MKYLEPITETSYLSAINAPQYRRIMRIFFNEYEKMHFQLYKEDVLERMREDELYADYSMDQLKLDLDALVNWKNLSTLQDPKRVYTIAEYKNKQYRYTMTEYALEIERMTVRLENLFVESGSLSTNLFSRLAESLAQAPVMKEKSPKEINEWWKNIHEDFRRLNQDYKDYLREFYSDRSEKLLKSVEFILHKDRFISYLKEFVQELQNHAGRISDIIQRNGDCVEQDLLEKVVQSELEIPHALSESSEMREEQIRQNIFGQWLSVKEWFLGSEGRPAESVRILEITNDIIRSIIQNAALIVQSQNWGISRKDDYFKFLDLFSRCETIEDAHRLSAHVFGVQHIAHFKANAERSTDRINSSVYEEDAMEYCLKPHTRTYRPRKDKSGFHDKTMEKLLQKNAYLQQMEEERSLILKYIHDGKLEVSEIHETVDERVRTVLLRWIAMASLSSEKKGRTEYGQEFRLVRKPGNCILQCKDGDLTMPNYVLEFLS
ncbi:MAG: TIGR02677 family protein [Anaerovoracaceae bacterium]